MRIRHFFIVVAAVMLIFYAGRTFISAFFPFQYREEISKYCAEYSLEPALVSAVICAESKFDANAKSYKGAIGLMQIMENTGSWVSESANLGHIDLYNPGDNIRVGCAYLQMLLKQYNGSEFLALCAYNAGEGRVNAWLSEADSEEEFRALLYEETRNYCDKIENYEKVYSILYWRDDV